MTSPLTTTAPAVLVEPAVGIVTRRVYDALPDMYREADAGQILGYLDPPVDDNDEADPDTLDDVDDGPVTGFDRVNLDDGSYEDPHTATVGIRAQPLLRYLACILDQLSDVDDILERIGYSNRGEVFPPRPYWRRYGSASYGAGTYGDGDASALTNPLTASSPWLPWLAQLLGQNIDGLTTAQARTRLARPSWQHGTAESIAAAIRWRSGAEWVDVIAHYAFDPFKIAVRLRTDELTATTWGDLEELLPTWADWEAAGTWLNIASAPVMAAVDSERPAGYQLTTILV